MEWVSQNKRNNSQQARSNPTNKMQAISMCTPLDGKGLQSDCDFGMMQAISQMWM